MKKFVIGDIHGGLKALQQTILSAPVTTNDTLIFLGDYVDGWSESPGVLDFLIEIQASQNCIFIKGNHDDLLLNYLKTGQYKDEWFIHGGASTINAYQKVSSEQKQKHIEFLENLNDYHLDGQNRLFIHAGFTNIRGIHAEFYKPMFYWDRTLWEAALALDPSIPIESDLYPNRLKLYREIFIGHTPVTRISKETPVNAACVWNVDTGAAFKGRLTLMDIDTKEFWQSDPLPQLYPTEKGRN